LTYLATTRGPGLDYICAGRHRRCPLQHDRHML